MRTSILIIISCFAFYACTPKNEEVTEEQIEIGSAEEVLDTVSNTRKDALQTDENNITPTFPLPQPVLQLLTDKYKNWQDPAYTAAVMQQAKDVTQGPGIVRGDFNGDELQDYAIQLQHEKQLLVLAVLDKSNGDWKIEEIRRDVLLNDKGTPKSPYLLQLVDAGTALTHSETGKKITAPYDAVALNKDENTTVYLLQDGKYGAYNLTK